MTNGVSTKYLVLKQSGPTPQLLKEYVDAGGDKTKLIVLDWPYPYVNNYDKRPVRNKVDGIEYIFGAVAELNVDEGYLVTGHDLRVSFEELLVGPLAETSIAESRGLQLGDHKVTFLRTGRGVRQWVKRGLDGVYSQGEEDTRDEENRELALLWSERIKEARAKCVASTPGRLAGQQPAALRCNEEVVSSSARPRVEPTKRTVIRIVRGGFTYSVSEGLG